MNRLTLASLSLMLGIACMPHAARAGGLCISSGGGGNSACDELPTDPPIIGGSGSTPSPFAGVINFTADMSFFPGKVTIDNAVTFSHINGATDAQAGSESHFVVSDSSKGIVIFPPTPDGNVDPADVVTPVTGFSAGSDGVATADLDGDGNDDIVAVSVADSSLSVMFGQSDGSFAPAVLVPVASSPGQFVLADIDGDGYPDLLVPDKAADALDIYLNDGHGGFLTPVPVVAGNSPISIAAADVDGDGDVDLVVGDDDTLSVLLNDGHGNFTVTSYPVGLHPDHITFGYDASINSIFSDATSMALNIAAWSDAAPDTAATLIGYGDGTFQPATLHKDTGCSFSYGAMFYCSADITPVSTGQTSGSGVDVGGGITSKPGKRAASSPASGGGGDLGLFSLVLLGCAALRRRFAR